MADDAIRIELSDGTFAIAEIDGYDRDAGGAGGSYIRIRVADHDSPADRSACSSDRAA